MNLPISPILLWFLIGIVFFALELAAPGFVIFFFGIGAWCTALAVWLTDLSLSVQLLVFLAGSLVSLLVLRRWLQGIFKGQTGEEEDSVNVVPEGAMGTVVEAIRPPAMGKVKYGGSFWQAVADTEIEKGTVVAIVSQNNLQIKVTPAENTEGK